MLTVDVPELGLVPVALEPREVRSGATSGALPGRVALGGPFWAPLPTSFAADDPETAAFRQDPAWRWVLGVLALSLDTDDDPGQRYERVWVDVALSRPDHGEPPAVAWSMKPDRETRPASRSTTVAISPSLKIADVGIDATVERGIQRILEEVSIEALNEKTPTARWVLRRTETAELRGCTRLALVVRAPGSGVVEATVDIGLVSARRRAVFFWARTTHERPRQTSVLP